MSAPLKTRVLLPAAIAFAAPIALALPATATTIELLGSATVSAFTNPSPSNQTQASDRVQQDVTSAAIGDAVVQGQVGASNAASFSASADASTGQLRFGLDGTRTENCGTTCASGFTAEALTTVTETLTVNGSGTLRSVMQVEADWDAPAYNFVANLFLASFGSVVDEVSFSFAPGMESPGSGVSQLLSVEQTFTNAVDLQVTAFWRMQGDIRSSVGQEEADGTVTGFLDASNTGTFFVFASDGLTFEAGNSAFLGNAAFGADDVAPIPLPAGVVLLLSALSGFAALSRRA